MASSLYPYCSKKCRHEARSANDDDLSVLHALETRRGVLAARIQECVVAARSAQEAQQRNVANVEEAIAVLTRAAIRAATSVQRQAEAGHALMQARDNEARALKRLDEARRTALALRQHAATEARSALDRAEAKYARASSDLASASAAAATFFGRLSGAAARVEAARVALATAQTETEQARVKLTEAQAQIDGDEHETASVHEVVIARDELKRAALATAEAADLVRHEETVGPSVQLHAEYVSATDVLLKTLGLAKATSEVKDAVVGCLVGSACPPGSFMMGAMPAGSSIRSRESPFQVTLTHAFTIGVFPVVQALYKAVMSSNPSEFSGDTRPVERVSWKDAVAFCKALNSRLGLPANHVGADGNTTAQGFRLPTEAEWEYAARAGTQSTYAGGDRLSALGWFDENSDDESHPVGKKLPNAWGLHDMSGNVSEWCQDRYGAYPTGAVTDPVCTAADPGRVCRGGAWDYVASDAAVTARGWGDADVRVSRIGFRLARTLT